VLAPPGLDGVVVADTAVGDVDGAEGTYRYRGRDAVELARTEPYEDVVALLLGGPVDGADRSVPSAVLDALGPRATLRSALSLVGDHEGMRPVLDLDDEQRRRDCVRLWAVTPGLVAALHRRSQGLPAIAPDPSLPMAVDQLRKLTGADPDEATARAFEQYLVVALDHGFSTSTFAARVVASTGADVAAAVVAAIGALSGPLHGGAPSRALDLLDAIPSPDAARQHVEAVLDRGERIMGFGNRIYRTPDPRAVHLREVVADLGVLRAAAARAVEEVVTQVLAERKPGRALHVNLELYAGVLMEHCGIPRELFTATFASSRMVGWCAHVLEQARTGRVIRPTARYVPEVP
jgi:citrate synthase